MKVILFGVMGMVGLGVLLECLLHPEVKSVPGSIVTSR